LLRQHNGYELFIDEQEQIQLRYVVPTEEWSIAKKLIEKQVNCLGACIWQGA
jgi:hypothetical protein